MNNYDDVRFSYQCKADKVFKAKLQKQIIKNIEIIGQRKLVILGDGRGVNGEILKKVLGQLRKRASVFPSLRLRLQTMSARL